MSNKKIFKKSIINLSTKVIGQLLNLLLIPVYIGYLETTEYGILNIGFVFLNFFILLGTFGMNDSLLRFYSKAKSARIKKKILSTILLFITLLTFLLLLIILPFQSGIALTLFNDPLYKTFLILVIIFGIFETWNNVLIMLLQVEGKNILYGKFFILKNFIKLILTYIFLNYFHLGLMGAVLALLVSSFLFIVLCYPIFKNKFSLSFSKKIFRILFKYGWPFVISGFSLIALFQVDQLILKYIIGLEAVAIYGFSYKIGSAIQYVNISFSLAWFPHLFSLKDNKAKERIYNMLGNYLTIIFIIGIIITIVNNFYLPFFLPNDYSLASEIIPWVLWGYVIYGISDFLGTGLFVKNKTIMYSIIAGTSAMLNVIFNFIFIPIYGIKAAAIVTFISHSFFTFVSFIFAQRHFNLILPYTKYYKILFPNIVLLFLSFFLVSENLIFNLICGFILIAFCIIIPIISGTLKWKVIKLLFSSDTNVIS